MDLPHLNFVHYAAMIYTYVIFGPHIPSHTSHEISSACIARLRELGGDVWFNCRAEKFLFKGDKLCGVETSLGTVECDYALPNINPNLVYGKMIPKELIPEREKKLSTARGNKYSGRFVGAYFCLDKSIEELGIKDYTIFMSETSDSEKSYNNIYSSDDISEHSTFVCYNVANPNFSPKGTTVCSFTTLGNPKNWEDLSQKEYFKKKEQFAKQCVELLKKKTGIDISGCIEEMSVATPWTFARYMGNPEGNVYGYENRDWDTLVARMQMVDGDYPIKGLRPIGACGPRGDGYNSAYVTGQMMAGLALRDMAQWAAAGSKGGE